MGVMNERAKGESWMEIAESNQIHPSHHATLSKRFGRFRAMDGNLPRSYWLAQNHDQTGTHR